MLMHPLFKTLALEPQVAVEHAAGYLSLAGAETRVALHHLRRRWMVGAFAMALAVVAVALAGVAVLLLAVHPVGSLAVPWLLAVPPAVVAAGALALWAWLRRHPAPEPYPLLREQWLEDRDLLATGGDA